MVWMAYTAEGITNARAFGSITLCRYPSFTEGWRVFRRAICSVSGRRKKKLISIISRSAGWWSARNPSMVMISFGRRHFSPTHRLSARS